MSVSCLWQDKLKNFSRNTAGGIAVSVAVATPVMLGGVGIAVDMAMFNYKRTTLQSAADGAAVAGVQELALAAKNDHAVTTITTVYVQKSLSGMQNVSTNLEIDRKAGSLKVALTESWTPYFAEFIGAEITPITVAAKASLVGSTSICILALNPTRGKAVHLDKSAKLKASGCGVYSNSDHNQGLRLDQASQISAALICSVGGYKSKTGSAVPEPLADCPAVPDPLIDRPEPSVGACKATGMVISSGKKTLRPGTYCKGLVIDGTADVNFEPGTYVISDGPFSVTGNAKIAGAHVGFFLSGERTVLNFSGNSSVSLTGALDNELAGMLFFESRLASLGRRHNLSSVNADVLTGTIYLPRGNLRIEPNATVAADSDYTAIIANTVELNEGPVLVMNSDYGASDVPVPEGLFLGGQAVLTE